MAKNKFVNCVIKETGYKDGCFVGFFYLPDKNLAIEKIILHDKCDQACKNQPCEHKKIANFFHTCSIITYELFVQTQ